MLKNATFFIIPKDSLFFHKKKLLLKNFFFIYTNNRIIVEAPKVPNTYFSIFFSNIVFLHLLWICYYISLIFWDKLFSSFISLYLGPGLWGYFFPRNCFSFFEKKKKWNFFCFSSVNSNNFTNFLEKFAKLKFSNIKNLAKKRKPSWGVCRLTHHYNGCPSSAHPEEQWGRYSGQ